MSTHPTGPDPEALVITQRFQELLQPAEIILLGSRATGEHIPDSDVDLMAICPDEDSIKQADETLRQLLKGKYDVPVVNVTTITREEFQRMAPLAQSWAGQSARHGVTPNGRKLEYRPEREPGPEEVREATMFWLTLADRHLDAFTSLALLERPTLSDIPAYQGQQALERSFKGLLAATNDGVRFRRDAAQMWRHVENTRPFTDRRGASHMEKLLAGTREPGGQGCGLARFSEAFRRGELAPAPTESEQQAIRFHLKPPVEALVAEALERAGLEREEILRRRGAA